MSGAAFIKLLRAWRKPEGVERRFRSLQGDREILPQAGPGPLFARGLEKMPGQVLPFHLPLLPSSPNGPLSDSVQLFLRSCGIRRAFLFLVSWPHRAFQAIEIDISVIVIQGPNDSCI